MGLSMFIGVEVRNKRTDKWYLLDNSALSGNNFLSYIFDGTVTVGWYDYDKLSMIHTKYRGQPSDISSDAMMDYDEWDDYVTSDEVRQVPWSTLQVPYDCEITAGEYYKLKEYGITPSDWATAYSSGTTSFNTQWSVPFKLQFRRAYEFIRELLDDEDFRILIRYV